VSPFILLTGSTSSTATLGAGCVTPWVKVYMMCVCRRHMWAVKAWRKMTGQDEEGEGETALTSNNHGER